MKNFGNQTAKRLLKIASFHWKPYSRLILYGDSAGWVLDWEMRELRSICSKLGVPVVKSLWKHAYRPQSVFFSNQFFLKKDDWMDLLPHRIGFSYFHGLPNTGDDDFDRVYRALRKNHEKLARIQVSHTEMRDAILQIGIDPSKVFLIPIGVNTSFFPFRTVEQKRITRAELGVPQSAFVIGSFQKDGIGWGDGFEPKLIKGPDVFLSTIKLLKRDIPELYVLLSGPARGYVKKGLDELQVPYKHVFLKSYPDIAKMFYALDVYLVASRQEGGPKAILESMASGIPIISTRVGQATDLIRNGENGWLADVEDIAGLAACVLQVYSSGDSALTQVLSRGRECAEINSYNAQLPLWASFMKGFVE